MFKKLKSFICKLFNIKACQCEDEHIEYYTKVPEPDVPVHEPCPRHRYHKRQMSYVPGRANLKGKL